MAGVVSTLLGGGPLMAVGGCLVGSNIPFTLAVIMPTNKALKSRECEDELPKIKSLLRIWGQLHSIRSLLGTAGFIVLTAGLITRRKR